MTTHLWGWFLAAAAAIAGLVALLVVRRLAALAAQREAAQRELEKRAARQEVVVGVGRAALGERSMSSVYQEAADLASSVLDGATATVRWGDADVDHEPTPLARHPIVDRERTWATLTVTADHDRGLTPDEHAFLASVAVVLSGMTARRRAEQDLRRRAHYDDLTGLPNRVLTLERLHEAVEARDRAPVGVLYVDLDGFKTVNDELGHEMGDALLAVLATRLLDGLGERPGTVGRLAGDEFVVVLPDCDDDELGALGHRLLRALSEPVDIGDRLALVSASIGAALASGADRDPRGLLHRADTAMYAAKEAGGGVVTVDAARAPSADRGRSGAGAPQATLGR